MRCAEDANRPRPLFAFLFEVLMNVSPVIFDIAIAIAYFYTAYGYSLALVLFVVMTSYVYVSVALTTWRTAIRRIMVERDVKTRGISADVLMNWESVKVSRSRDSIMVVKTVCS